MWARFELTTYWLLCCAADAKKEAEVAKEREVALWQEALKTGEQVHPLTEETLNKHMQGPIIIEDERNAQNVSHLPAQNTV